MSVLGIGIDAIEIDRVHGAMHRRSSFREYLFTECEREYCDAQPQPARHYAARFAAKEAGCKCLGLPFSSLRDFETVLAGSRPLLMLSGRARELADDMGVGAVHISLTHTRGLAVACAVAVAREA
ncbi:MAG: holo-ACP synthase [Candidatus Geothermincolia bacterium]